MANGNSKRQVYMAREVGFCFGVKRAINLTRQALAERGDVFILGDLVHNKRVTDELEAKGLRKVEDYRAEKSGTMVIRAHGLPKTRIQEARDRGLEVRDATCPIVLRAQEAAQALEARGCQVVIVGDRNHAEIKGILGALERPALVVDNVTELREAKEQRKLMRKVGVIFQTTHALELCREIVNELVFMCKEVQIINTICKPVRNRQDDAVELASNVDLMIVVGSQTSANTMELAALCRHHNPNTIQVQNADELEPAMFEPYAAIGIASGLSTPEDLVEAVRVKVITYESPVSSGA
ncbi:MAG TPA: 4-hydroxy-3-methylbut-2-enyl diphosphate reductase [Chthonomonadales bacterium]|nr:4-hydroxy-3-methylbut-2-enyl diphosphate reductase [Chthonomonadales bacterium]